MSTETTVTVDNIGAIEHLKFALPKGGGVMVARGTHGSGKSTLVKAIGARLGGDASDLEPSDGYKKGELSIDHDGSVAKLTVRASGNRNTGTLEVTSLEGRFDISALIDPGIKDVEACELARVKALISLVGNVELSPNDLFASVGIPDATELPGVFDNDDVIALVAAAKREMEKLARKWEKERDQQQRTVQTLKESLDAEESTADALPLDEAKKSLETIISSEAGDKIRHDVWEKQKGAIEHAKVSLEGMQEPADIKTLEEEIDQYEAERTQLMASIRHLQTQLQDLESSRGEADRRLAEAKRLALRRETVLDAIKPLETEPLETDYTDMKAKAHHNVDEARRAINFEARVELLKNEQLDYKHKVRLADAWRTSAKSCWQELFSRLPGDVGMRVFDDQLVTPTGRSDREPYRELSTGERAFLAIDIAVAATEPPALLTIRQELWDGFNTATKQAVADRARKHGCWILTAEIGDGALKIVELKGADDDG